MGTKALKIAMLLMIVMAWIFSNCNPKRRFGCDKVIYNFNIGITAAPDKDSIFIGDTIWLHVETPVILKDLISGKEVDYSNTENLGTDINFDQLLENDSINPCVTCFNFVLKNGSFLHDPINADRNLDYTFDEINGKYIFNLAVIPKNKGVFSISPGNAANVYRKNDKCTKASFSITFKDTDQHLYLYEQSRPGYTPSEYESTHMYCFKVY